MHQLALELEISDIRSRLGGDVDTSRVFTIYNGEIRQMLRLLNIRTCGYFTELNERVNSLYDVMFGNKNDTLPTITPGPKIALTSTMLPDPTLAA